MRGYPEDKDGTLRRLRRMEGQVRGLQAMIGAQASAAVARLIRP